MSTAQAAGAQAEPGIQERLAVEVYERAEELCLYSFDRMGINPGDLLPTVHPLVTITSKDRLTSTVIDSSSQLRVDEDTLRLVKVVGKAHGQVPEFRAGRHFEPNGNMWMQADSSQGMPWYNGPLYSGVLVRMVERLETLASSDTYIEMIFRAFKPVDFDPADLQGRKPPST